MAMVAADQVRVRCTGCDGGVTSVSTDRYPSADYVPNVCIDCEDGWIYLRCGCGARAVERIDDDSGRCATCSDMYTAAPEVCACGCGARLTPHDRLPMPDGGRVRVSCVLRAMAARNLESPNRTDKTDRTNARSFVGSFVREGDTIMAKPSGRLVERMREDGFIPAVEAAEITGHAASTIYGWIALGRLKAIKSGTLCFVSRAALEEKCPILKKTAAGGSR